jgi:hypothetical protein
MRALLAAMLFGFAGLALAQAQGGDTGRGSVPPGTAKDGSRPADGAITGGSIRPGESGGMPTEADKTPSVKAVERCKELSGSLREDCLKKEQGAGAGATGAPDIKKEQHPERKN